MAAAATLALLLADSRTPSGGYAHSGGLERAVADGLAAGDVAAFVGARLQTVGLTEAAVAACAARATTVGDLLALDDELAARTPSAPLRTAARQLGRALLRLADRLWPDGTAPLRAYSTASEQTPRPVVLGAVARVAGLGPLAAARLSLYEDAAGVAAAAVKLLPVDAADASAWVAAAAPAIEDLAARAAAADPGDLPGAATPLLDLRSLAHHDSPRRLFVS
jgi:urease accessory protein